MAENRLPLLRGRITSVDTYQAPQQGGSPPKIPSLDPKAHRAKLLQQLDAIGNQVQARPETVRDELASREIVAVRPAPDTELAATQLDDSRSDARLIGVVPETGTVLLDVANADLDYLRKKLDAFADDAKVEVKTHKDGTTTTHRDKERAIAPVDTIRLATLDDMRGARLRTETLVADRTYWFEIACRGGYRRPLAETTGSRAQISRQLHRIGALQNLDEFVGPEQVYFFVRLTRHQLDALRAATDCIYEVELAPPPLRDLKLLEDVTTKDIRDFALQPPEEDAPSVVVLDTGVATGHPLLKPAILTTTTAGPEIPSAEDTYGHGTKMAGLALYHDLGAAIERGGAVAPHWLQSSRLLVKPGFGTASDENYEKWPALTQRAVRAAEDADPRPRNRVFTLAVTRTMQDAPLDGLVPTLWSHAVDQLAFHTGHGRLMVVSAGNARDEQWLALAEQHPQLQLSEKIHQPAQATNALTVGAYTERVELPSTKQYAEARVVATRPGGISPFTSTGLPGNEWPIKPDVVLEGGNLALSGTLPNESVPTLCALTTSHRHTLGWPLGQLAMTSEATARAAHLAARIWALEPKLRPETVRGLIVHSASWTPTMRDQFTGINDRLQACGYGVPNERVASECAEGWATVIVEDVMPNVVVEEEPKKEAPKRPTTRTTVSKARRKVKLYRLPLPESLLSDSDADVELRVTLSYFAEPNKFGRTVFYGLDLKWDMQGPQESEDEFLQRINVLKRPKGPNGKPLKVSMKKSFNWDIGIQPRSRGTVQSDRWRGRMSELVGDKLIAIVPVLGWWDQRRTLKTQEMRFSLAVSVFGPGVYAAIKPRVEAEVLAPVEV
ncbi:S8 family peptidase [Archangium violaceum]|uniref:S8 family peptidase n=1 Tax=Archangium violaceum TaxID=83451 RepID=UPI000A0242DB|nr:S8 family peptidase [Archangium violaceum]